MSTKTLVVFELPDRQLQYCRPPDMILSPQRGSVYMLGGQFYRVKDSVQSLGDNDGSHLMELLNTLYPNPEVNAALFETMTNIGAGEDDMTQVGRLVVRRATLAAPERLVYLQMERFVTKSITTTGASLSAPSAAVDSSTDIATTVVLEIPGKGLLKCDLDHLGMSPQQGSVYCYGGSTFEVAHAIEPVAHQSNDLFLTLSALFGPTAVGGLLASMKTIGSSQDNASRTMWMASQEPERLLYLQLKSRRHTTVTPVFASA